MHRIRGLLSTQQLDELDRLLAKAEFADGRTTAGGAGQAIKFNQQVKSFDQYGGQANQLVHQALSQSEEFKGYALPLKISAITFSRYTPGMTYGDHTDNALNWDNQRVIRSDLSFTIFLSPPDEYEGGELIAKVLDDEIAVKYGRGDMVIYPSGLTHRVDAVTAGCRRVALGWLQSIIPEQDRREILHAIFKTRNEIIASHGRTEQFMRLDFAFTNLQRLWSRV